MGIENTGPGSAFIAPVGAAFPTDSKGFATGKAGSGWTCLTCGQQLEEHTEIKTTIGGIERVAGYKCPPRPRSRTREEYKQEAVHAALRDLLGLALNSTAAYRVLSHLWEDGAGIGYHDG